MIKCLSLGHRWFWDNYKESKEQSTLIYEVEHGR